MNRIQRRACNVALMACLTMGSAAAADEPVAVGDAAPDFTAMGIDGQEFRLSEKLQTGDRNIVLIFSRASW